jgi:hypothetical protein
MAVPSPFLYGLDNAATDPLPLDAFRHELLRGVSRASSTHHLRTPCNHVGNIQH